MRLLTIVLTGVLSLPAAAAAQPAFRLDAQGKTLRAASHVSALRLFSSFRIEMPELAGVELCKVTYRPGPLTLRFIRHNEVTDPYVILPGSDGSTDIAHDRIGSSVSPPRSGFSVSLRSLRAGYFVYNIQHEPVADTGSLEECKEKIAKARKDGAKLEEALQAAQGRVATTETLLVRLGERLKSLQQDAGSYAGIPDSTAEVARILRAVAQTRADLASSQTALDDAREEVRVAKEAIEKSSDGVQDSLSAPLDRAEYLYEALTRGAVVKVGAIFVGGRREAVYYDFSARGPASTLQLQPIGDYPTITHDETVFVVIANVDAARHPHAFRLSAGITAGSAINIAPVRGSVEATGPVPLAVDPGKPPREKPEVVPPVATHAYRDVVMRLRDDVPPNGIAEVTIMTERPTKADPAVLEAVTLVDKVKFPQFRARYRFNLTTGLFRSNLREQTFSKVRIQDDDPSTEEIDESRYRIDEHTGEPSIKPGFALSFYPFPVDIQTRFSWRDLMPAPTIGFAFQSPQDNIYAGFSLEPTRHVQIFAGLHFGTRREVVTRNDVSEDRDSTDVVTRERRLSKGEFTWGVTFNLSFIGKIFK